MVFNTKLANEKYLNGMKVKRIAPPQFEQFKENKGMVYVEFENGTRKWIYRVEMEEEWQKI